MRKGANIQCIPTPLLWLDEEGGTPPVPPASGNVIEQDDGSQWTQADGTYISQS